MISKLLLSNKKVLEIGGPSKLLSSIYESFDSICFLNLNESSKVHSQSSLPKNTLFNHEGDASDFKSFEEHSLLNKFDLVLSCHTLEHFANPIKALFLWNSCILTNGKIITIVPNKEHCWDKNRPHTSFDHILKDYKNKTEETDMTHVYESSCMIETRPSYFEDVGTSNSTRVIHHHVFSPEVLAKCHEYCGFSTLDCYIDPKDPLQIVYIGTKNG